MTTLLSRLQSGEGDTGALLIEAFDVVFPGEREERSMGVFIQTSPYAGGAYNGRIHRNTGREETEMTDYISREAAIAAVENERLASPQTPDDAAYDLALDHAEAAIRAVPPTPAGDYEALCQRLEDHATDWNGEKMPDNEPAKADPSAGTLRQAAAAIRALSARVQELEAINAAHGEIICRKCGVRQDGPKGEITF